MLKQNGRNGDMISIGYLFIETPYESAKDELSKFFKMPKVNEFIKLSKKLVENGVDDFSKKEAESYVGLFEDPTVKAYIAAARRTGERDGWIRGIFVGSIGGGLGGGLIGAGLGDLAGAISVGLLGAVVGGAALGWTFSKALSWIRKWKAEDDIIKLGRSGGVIGKTNILTKVD